MFYMYVRRHEYNNDNDRQVCQMMKDLEMKPGLCGGVDLP